jgi:hypothetical protein
LGRPACQRCELILSPLSPSPSLVADADRWSCADTRAIAQRELSEPVTFEREATPAVFRFGGNHSPRGVKLRQVGPVAFASVPGPSLSSPPGSPGDRRDAKRGGGRGVTFRSEGEGTRWDLADAVTGRGWVPPVNPKERKYATPLFGGAHFGDRGRIRGRRGAHPRPLLRGTGLGGRARSPDPSPHRRPRREPPRARSGPVDRVEAA